MADTDKKIPEQAYDTSKSYNQLVYGRYIFVAKIVGVIAAIVLGAYLILINIGHSLNETKKMLTVEEYLTRPEAKRAIFRQDVRFMLLTEMLRYKTDTVLVVVNDPKYLAPQDRGVYTFPEERLIFGCRLFAMELILKRALLEMQYPFLFTRVILADSLKAMDLSRYIKKESFFPLYIASTLKPVYTIADSTVPGKERKIFLPDSIAAYFTDLYAKHSAERLFSKYVGDGPNGPYLYLSANKFMALPDSAKMEQRRAFLKLSEADQLKVRNVDLAITGDYGCVGIDETPGFYFSTLVERKLHELECTSQLSPMLDMTTFSMLYPMARVHTLNFIGESGARTQNALLLIALKSGRAPALYTLEQKDCPRALVQGMFADLTDYLKGWDQFKNFPKFPMKNSSLNGRYFGIPRKTINSDMLAYRRDWLEEPGVIEWIKKKGWIHPVDHRPYIPFNWTYDDFRTVLKLMTDSDPTHKRRGFVTWPQSFLYLEAQSPFYSLGEQFLKPDPSRKNTWVFYEDNPVIRDGMKIVHDMFWIDKSVRCGVEINYASANDDFSGGRAGFVYTTSTGTPYASLTQKYTVFGKARSYGEIVGMTSRPGSGKFPAIDIPDCALAGFNPFLTPDQLNLAMEWVKQKYYGEFVNNSLYYEVKEARTLGSESIVLRNALASPYVIDFTSLDIDFRSAFPANYVEYYDMLRTTQALEPPPNAEDVGLLRPPIRELQDQ
ncbi:MAG: hypothetical protein V1913_11230, partial [Fibrobacterota bacterium]